MLLQTRKNKSYKKSLHIIFEDDERYTDLKTLFDPYSIAWTKTDMDENRRYFMEKNLNNKIRANGVNISSLLKNQKFYIEYFQREYYWIKNFSEKKT